MQQSQPKPTQVARRPTNGLSIGQILSSMTLQHSMRSMSAVSKQAIALRERYRKPSALLAEYHTALQGQIGAACPTVDLCQQIPSPTLCVVGEAYPSDNGKSAVIIFLQTHLTMVCTYACTKDKMDDAVMADLCQQIAAEHGGLTMLEFVLFCSRYRSKRYGDFYGTVSPSHILAALNEFEREKRDDAGRAYEREEQQRREREAEESRKNAITWEEYCRLKGKDPKSPSPYSQLGLKTPENAISLPSKAK